MSNYIIRECTPGEPSLVVHFYYELFEKQFDFLPSTEQYFLHAMTDLFGDLENNKLFVIEDRGTIVGSVCIVKLNKNEAQLRLFGTSPVLQGKGFGMKLMETAMNYCKEKGFHHVILWTIDICKAARHLYGKFGFKKTDTKPNTTWANYPMTEEKWEYADEIWERQCDTRYWETIL